MPDSYYAGFDVGSSAVHYAVIDGTGTVVYSARPLMHFADPIGAVRRAWTDVAGFFPEGSIRATAFTGSGAENFPEVMPGVIFLYDSVSIPAGAAILDPDAECVVHIGAKDAYFFRLRRLRDRTILQEWKAGSKCGGGTGTLLQKQCRRFFRNEVAAAPLEDIDRLPVGNERETGRDRNAALMQETEEAIMAAAEKEAAASFSPSEFLARCGVVIQSDLIHKQNEGVNRADNLAGLFRTVARNYKIDVMGNEPLRGRRAIATGGVVANRLVLKALTEFLQTPLTRPDDYQNIGAVGAAAVAAERKNVFVFSAGQLEAVREYSRQQRKYAEPLSLSLGQIKKADPSPPAEKIAGRQVVIGIDGGSTTTKGALVDLSSGRLLDKLYIKTHGNPEASLKEVLRYLSRHREDVVVRGIGATGSARKLYEKILLSRKRQEGLKASGTAAADRVTDEITCHALGVRYYNTGIDTIFEIGGQDMKFTTFNAETGAVRNAKMNYSCQAGSGQTMENMADLIGLDVASTLQEYALRAERVPVIDATCGVFMEMDENRLIAEGFSREEIAAAIVRGTAASYFYKFVGGAQQVGEACSAQGGPCLGDAFLAALSQVTGRPLYAYPDREIFGAWGAALDVIRGIEALDRAGTPWDTAFRGWAVTDTSFDKEKKNCREVFGGQSCGVRDCGLHLFHIGDETIISNGFCPRGNSEATGKPRPNYVDIYHSVYEKHFKQFGSLLSETPDNGHTIGIRRSTATLGPKGVWSAALLAGLGLHPVVTPRSDQQIARIGVDHSQTSFCIARKLATGHAKILADHPGVKFLYNPAFVEVTGNPGLKYCVYTESEPYLINGELTLDRDRQIIPVLEFGEPESLIETFRAEFRRIGLPVDRRRMKKALARAEAAEADFLKELYALGEKFLEKTAGKIVYVGVGRDYVVLDPEASSHSGAMFSTLRGLHYIPQIFLRHRYQHLPIDDMAKNEYWVESVDILKAHRFIAGSGNLFPVRMMNFGCGPDSMKLFQEELLQERAGKPMLTLLTDAQTNNAPFVTRTEAFERVVAGGHYG